MYKYTRKERIAKYMGDSHYELTQLLKDLLAQKEDKKEIKDGDGFELYGIKLFAKKGVPKNEIWVMDGLTLKQKIKINPTPSPLEDKTDTEKLNLIKEILK